MATGVHVTVACAYVVLLSLAAMYAASVTPNALIR